MLKWGLLFLFCTGIALGQEILPIFGAPTSPVVVINATSDRAPLIAIDTANHHNAVVEPGAPTTINVEYFSEEGDAFFAVDACTNTQKAYQFNAPPEWAMDAANFSDAALTSEYLYSHPSVKNLKDRVDKIKRVLRDQLGGKTKTRELNAWFRIVKREGLSEEVTNCNGAIPVQVRIASATLMYNFGAQTTVTISGDRAHGYYATYGQYAY